MKEEGHPLGGFLQVIKNGHNGEGAQRWRSGSSHLHIQVMRRSRMSVKKTRCPRELELFEKLFYTKRNNNLASK